MKTFILILVTAGTIYGIEMTQEECFSNAEDYFELRRDPTTEKLADGNYQYRIFFGEEKVLFYYCALKVDRTGMSYDGTSTFPNHNACRREDSQSICVDRRE
tara:strand:+ start:183 stop:488 length:306 start_codon:yes stop_codon:yes gene_type:complete